MAKRRVRVLSSWGFSPAETQASTGTTEVSANVAGASQAADQSRALAGNVMTASGELGQHATALMKSVDIFLAGLQAA